MNVQVTPAQDAPPPTRVVLDMSVEEFAMLESLRYAHLADATDLRMEIREAFARARGLLHPEWRALVDNARNERGSSRNVAKLFAGRVSS